MKTKTKKSKLKKDWTYSPAPESTDHVQISEKNDLFINGKFIPPEKGKYFETINPANEEKLADVAEADKADVDKAVKAARKAYEKVWSKMDPAERGKYIYRIARLIQERAREFSVIETMDGGKPIRESRDIDIPLVSAHFFYYAGWTDKLEYAFPGKKAKPIGVAGQIIPWNFPLLMAAWKIAPALATGNTVILKPAETTPLTAMKLAEIIQEADLPPGVVNIINGDGKTGRALVEHPDVNKIAFTGSTDVGKLIMKSIAGTDKKYTLELGGKAANIIFEDAAIDQAVEGIIDGIFFNQGHVCCAGSRLFVQESVAETVVSKLKDRMESLIVGNPLDKNTDIGAINSKMQLDKIKMYVDIGKNEGGTIHQSSCKLPKKGYWYAPTLFEDVSQSHRIVQEEIFGPVLISLTFRTPSEAVAIANNTPYGLAASIWSENINLALDVAPKVKAGVIWINSTNLFDAACGFGGFKESGFGREGGSEGIRAYTKINLPVVRGSKKTNHKIKISLPMIDRTPKLYIGGKQKRPDGGYSFPLNAVNNSFICDIAQANRKDVRDSVEIAAKSFAKQLSNFNRSQILFYLAENLQQREKTFVDLLVALRGSSPVNASKEFSQSCERLFYYAAMADKFEGDVHNPPMRGLTLAMKEPLGVMTSILSDDSPLLNLVTVMGSVFSTGNTNIIVPGQRTSLIATELYQVLDTSDVPGGYVNILTAKENELNKTLSQHENIEGIWYFGADSAQRSNIIKNTTSNLKRYWCPEEKHVDWTNTSEQFLNEFLYQSTQVKNIWIPYGE